MNEEKKPSSGGFKITKKPSRRELLKALGTVQDLVGRAKGITWDDKNPNRIQNLIPVLEQAFNICVDAQGFDPPVG